MKTRTNSPSVLLGWWYSIGRSPEDEPRNMQRPERCCMWAALWRMIGEAERTLEVVDVHALIGVACLNFGRLWVLVMPRRGTSRRQGARTGFGILMVLGSRKTDTASNSSAVSPWARLDSGLGARPSLALRWQVPLKGRCGSALARLRLDLF